MQWKGGGWLTDALTGTSKQLVWSADETDASLTLLQCIIGVVLAPRKEGGQGGQSEG